MGFFHGVLASHGNRTSRRDGGSYVRFYRRASSGFRRMAESAGARPPSSPINNVSRIPTEMVLRVDGERKDNRPAGAFLPGDDAGGGPSVGQGTQRTAPSPPTKAITNDSKRRETRICQRAKPSSRKTPMSLIR